MDFGALHGLAVSRDGVDRRAGGPLRDAAGAVACRVLVC
jgi:hypothetical protein